MGINFNYINDLENAIEQAGIIMEIITSKYKFHIDVFMRM